MALTECEEVRAGAWSDVVEQLEDNGLLCALEVDAHGGVLPRLGAVDQLLVGLCCLLFVDDHARVVHVREVVQGVLSELLAVANVFPVVQVDEVIAGVLVEDTLQLVGGLLLELLPLGLEELEAFSSDAIGVLAFEVPGSSNTFVELCISYLSCNCDFDWTFVYHTLNFNLTIEH